MKLLDMHTHLPEEHLPSWRSWSTAWTLQRMDELGVARSAVLTVDGLRCGRAARGNDIMAEACAGSGGRLIPFASVDPHEPGAADELTRAVSELGCQGLKLHPWLQGFSPLEDCMRPVAEAAVAAGVPILVHDGTPPYSSPLQIAYLAEQYPELTVVLAHGGLFDLWQDAVAAALRHPNVHIVMCGTAPLAIFRRIIDAVDHTRLSIGTDGGYADPAVAAHRLAVHRRLLAELDPAAAALIAFGNAERILGLAPSSSS